MLLHWLEEGLNLNSECILVSEWCTYPKMKLWFTNKYGKVVLNEKTITVSVFACTISIYYYSCAVVYLIDACDVGAM